MTAADYSNTRGHVTRSAMVTGAAQAYRITLSFFSGILLARLLSPADFGLIAMISTCLAFVGVIQDLGLNQVTIQRAQISHAQMSALFWLSLGFSFLMAMAFAGSAPLVAWFFGDPRLIPLSIAFAFLILLGGSQSQQFAVLNREQQFKTLAILDILGATTSATVGITVAYFIPSYWALYAANFASSFVSFVCVWTVCRFRPGRPEFQGDFREIAKFSSAISGFGIVNYFARNADNLLIGRFYGSEQLGLYDRAYRLLLFPLSQIQAPIGRVMLPLLSRLQAEPKRYCGAYLECVSLLMTASQPGLVLVTVFAGDVFLTLLGPQWVAAAPIFQWLGLCGIHQVMTSTMGWLFLSQGRGGDYFKIGIYGSVTTLLSFAIGLPWGPIGVAAAYAISDYIVRVPVVWFIAGRRGPVGTHELYILAAPHFLAAAISGAALLWLSYMIRSPSVVLFVMLIIFSYATYILVIMLFTNTRSIILRNTIALMNLFRK
jgi:PST family polysaccharide transporter